MHRVSIAVGTALALGLSVAYAQDQKAPPKQSQHQQMERGMGGMMQGDGMMAQMSRMIE